MKNDINLLYKRKTKTYSNKKIIIIAVTLVVIAVGFYAGIALPSGTLKVAKLEVAELERQVNSTSSNQKDLAEKIQQEASLAIQLSELNALKDSKADVIKYLEAIDRSLPTSKAKITQLLITTSGDASTGEDDIIDIAGIALDDEAVAIFCLRLREQNIFKNVFLSSTTTSLDGKISSFVISVTLPSSLSSTAIIQQIEKKDVVTSNSNAAPGGK